MKKSVITVLLALGLSVQALADSKHADIIFMHDVHSFIDPCSKSKVIIDRQKKINPETIVVDAGDFSMGTLYQTVFEKDASELRTLGLIGVDATTIGNHEFDYGPEALAAMFNSALDCGDTLPQFVLCNVDWTKTDDYTKTLRAALVDRYGSKPYTMIKKGGLNVAVIGVFGKDAIFCSPGCQLTFTDQIESVKKCVEQIKAVENADLIVCLSHSGTNPELSKSEDELLAKAVPELDVIISGHTHTYLEKGIQTGNTVIASCKAYNAYLGTLSLDKNEQGRWTVSDYKLIDLSQNLEEDEAVNKRLEKFRREIDREYLVNFNYTSDQVIGIAQKDISLDKEVPYLMAWAMNKQLEKEGINVDVTIVPSGCVRGTYSKGNITVSKVFETYSLGAGEDGLAGFPLTVSYVTGKALKNACQIDSSLGPGSDTLKLYMHGLAYEYNPNRLIFDKVTQVYLLKDGKKIPVEDDKMYLMAIDYYSCMMLSNVSSMTKGLISLVTYKADGTPVTDFQDVVARKKDGTELKGWAAIADSINGLNGNAGKVDGMIPDFSQSYDIQHIAVKSANPFKFFAHPSNIALLIYGVIIVLAAILILIVLLVVKLIKKIKDRK